MTDDEINKLEKESVDEFDKKMIASIGSRRPIHPWRWRILACWIIVFTLMTGYSLREQRGNINDLKDAKANVAALKHTNCGLRNFLLAAYNSRLHASMHETGRAKQSDLDAARAYGKLLAPFHGERRIGNCPEPGRPRG